MMSCLLWIHSTSNAVEQVSNSSYQNTACHPSLRLAPPRDVVNLTVKKLIRLHVSQYFLSWDAHLIMLILLSHGLLLSLSLALVAVILKPNFHLKWAKRKDQSSEHYTKVVNWRISFKGRQLQTINFLPIGGVDEVTNTCPPPISRPK